jgi:hypothetical protein
MIFVNPQHDKNHVARMSSSAFCHVSPDSFVRVNKKLMESPNEEKFVPKGAMAFFVCLVLLALAFWYGIYLLMIDRT